MFKPPKTPTTEAATALYLQFFTNKKNDKNARFRFCYDI